MTDLFVRTQAEFQRRQDEFLHLEVAACLRNAETASNLCQGGNRKSAERIVADAEQAYAALREAISDPAHAKKLTIKARQELAGKMGMLRDKLDRLKALNVPRMHAN
jgi:hypothetical protein